MPNTDRNKPGSSLKKSIDAAARMTERERADRRAQKAARKTGKPARPRRGAATRGERPSPVAWSRSAEDASARSYSARGRAHRGGSGRGGGSRRQTASVRGGSSKHPDAGPNAARADEKARPRGRRRGAGRARIAIALVACVVVLTGVLLYPVAQGFYQTTRDNQRAQVQIEAYTERNAKLQEENEALNTDEGIEAQAREDYNYVPEGESAASVTNAQSNGGSTDLPAQVDENAIKAPQTWYYAILDAIFFYDN